ncbi:peptidase C65 Otubain-domain-containing protein [Crepidotus variabilis]|uniref:ubiquitinyl hydrolase 1 n=1 Tax=Crepidotus variabilis TaxID=179855 RepID=A0A9P6EHM1_9AGAR|nr:peptidase C65 Otubain-domain-containing protein [Crepidotus variabilis]
MDGHQDSPRLPSTPRAVRQSKELPLDSDAESLAPLELPSGNGLLNFPNEELSEYTPSQIYDMNQQLLDDSVPQRPLIEDLTPISDLRSEYEKGTGLFVNQIDWLSTNGFKSIRRTRGDGDCFYRSLGFAYVDSIINSTDKEFAVARSLSKLAETQRTLDQAGIEKIVYENFYEEFVSMINAIVPNTSGKSLNTDSLLVAFQNPEVSNSVVIYLRFLTSAQIRLNRQDYEGFVVHPETKDIMDVDSFCSNIVQAMGKEADNVEIQALCLALGLDVNLAYLNGSRGDGVDFIKFRNDPDPNVPPLMLLYRPGHYDVLPRKQ